MPYDYLPGISAAVPKYNLPASSAASLRPEPVAVAVAVSVVLGLVLLEELIVVLMVDPLPPDVIVDPEDPLQEAD